jgi:uncharacterized protein YndB with AHSA1/START domain
VPAEPAETELVEREVRIAAAPEVVFEYFTDPAKLVRWMGSEATLDPRPGGMCRVEIHGSVMLGRFEQVDFPSTLTFTWGWERETFAVPPQSTAVEVSFTPDDGGTIVRLSHSRLPEAAVPFHRAGWRHYMDRLSAVAAGSDPGPDAWADIAFVEQAVRNEGGRG